MTFNSPKYLESNQMTSPMKKEIDDLIAKFKHRNKNWPKQPLEEQDLFGDGCGIDEDTCLAPIDTLTNERKLTAPNALLLDDRCRKLLTEVWQGSPTINHGYGGALNESACQSKGGSPQNVFHCYQPKKIGMPIWDSWRNHPQFNPKSCCWWCRNISDAANKYSWSGSGFNRLAMRLQYSLTANDQATTAALCHLILEWGGLKGRSGGFQDWIARQVAQNRLIDSLIDATRILIPQSSLSTKNFNGEYESNSYLMNSGSTKVYAAIALNFQNGLCSPLQDVLIYDSRVAAALALTTKYVLQTLGHSTLPPGLKFPVAANTKQTNRDPSTSTLVFPKFSASARSHAARAEYARLGSRYIQAIIGTSQPSKAFITAEQGLFMIGYKV